MLLCQTNPFTLSAVQNRFGKFSKRTARLTRRRFAFNSATAGGSKSGRIYSSAGNGTAGSNSSTISSTTTTTTGGTTSMSGGTDGTTPTISCALSTRFAFRWSSATGSSSKAGTGAVLGASEFATTTGLTIISSPSPSSSGSLRSNATRGSLTNGASCDSTYLCGLVKGQLHCYSLPPVR